MKSSFHSSSSASSSSPSPSSPASSSNPKSKVFSSSSLAVFLENYFYILFILFALLEELSTIRVILNEMATGGQELPLQSLLNQAANLWYFVDQFWLLFIPELCFIFLFRRYAMGGITIAVLTWSLKTWRNTSFLAKHSSNLKKPEPEPEPDPACPLSRINMETQRKEALLFSFLFLITILYGLDKSLWVPYAKDPTWQIDMLHKQQLSAGAYFSFFYLIWFTSSNPRYPLYQKSRQFLSDQRFLFYTFFTMMLDNLASFSWFPYGYEEIFRYGEHLYSIDKLFHFFLTSGITIILLGFYIKNTHKAITSMYILMIAWELFEISLNPLEAYDTILDLIVNSMGMLTSWYTFNRFHMGKKLTQQVMSKNKVSLSETST